MNHSTKRGLITLAVVVGFCASRAAAQTARDADAAALSLQQELVARAAATQAALGRRADAQVAMAMRERTAVIARNKQLLEQASLDVAERRRIETENARLQQERGEFITLLERSDPAFRSAIDEFRRQIAVLVDNPSPEQRALLNRYAAGDAAALDGLQAAVRAERQTRETALVAAARVRAQLENAAEQRGVAALILDARDKGERTTAMALAAWQEASTLDDGDAWTWIHVATLQQDAGQLREARSAVERAVKAAKGDRERGAALATAANILVEGGDLAGARTRLEEASTIFRGAAVASPSIASTQLDLGRILSRLGDIVAESGDLTRARVHYEESLAIERRLAVDDPANNGIQQDLSATVANLGKLFIVTGDLRAAREQYEEGVAISRRLASGNPNSADAQRGLAVTLVRLGDVLLAADNPGDAYQYFDESLKIRRRLAEADRTSLAARRDVMVALIKLGDVLVESTLLKDARKQFEEAFAIAQDVAKANVSSAQAQRDLTVLDERLGGVLLALGDASGARLRFEERLEVTTRLATANPSSAQAQRDLLLSHVKLAGVPGSEGHWVEALKIAEGMDQSGLLAPRDRPLLEQIRNHVRALR